VAGTTLAAGLRSGDAGYAPACLLIVLAVIAAGDIAVVAYRKHRGEPG
jgi:hypothetical protein